MKWKLVVKFANPHTGCIGIVWENGAQEEVARILFPNDQMLGENVKAMEEMAKILNKRYRASC